MRNSILSTAVAIRVFWGWNNNKSSLYLGFYERFLRWRCGVLDRSRKDVRQNVIYWIQPSNGGWGMEWPQSVALELIIRSGVCDKGYNHTSNNAPSRGAGESPPNAADALFALHMHWTFRKNSKSNNFLVLICIINRVYHFNFSLIYIGQCNLYIHICVCYKSGVFTGVTVKTFELPLGW